MMTKVKFKLESAGYCEAKQSHVLRGTSSKTIKFYATYGHIEHPIYGHILFDSGYTKRFYEVTKKLPFKLYAKLTKVFVTEKEEAINKLKKKGVDSSDIKYIIVSHFHADHIGGLKDFPKAKFICSEDAYNDIRNKKGVLALKKGFIPALMPEDFLARTQLISFKNKTKKIEGLGNVIDLFDDESILICQLDGHAKGQIGAIINAEKKTFLISDAAWLIENYTNLHLPSHSVRLFFNSWRDFKDSLQRVHLYSKAYPETIIIPCHCEKTYRKLTNLE